MRGNNNNMSVKSSIVTKSMMIGPKEATDMLKAHDASGRRQRKIKRTVVSRYARDMEDGNWVESGETIVVSESGAVLDGRHRLTAVIKSQSTVPMLVVSGVEDSAFRVRSTRTGRQRWLRSRTRRTTSADCPGTPIGQA